jgi:hypothetical protein
MTRLANKIERIESHISSMEQNIIIQNKQGRKQSMRVINNLSAQRDIIEGNLSFVIDYRSEKTGTITET